MIKMEDVHEILTHDWFNLKKPKTISEEFFVNGTTLYQKIRIMKLRISYYICLLKSEDDLWKKKETVIEFIKQQNKFIEDRLIGKIKNLLI
jgi:hypothetical protein